MNNRSRRPLPGQEARMIEEKAAEWFGRCELGLTPAQEKELLHWLERDPRHGEAMREMDDTWELLDSLRDSRKLRGQRLGSPRAPIFRPLAFAAAAAVIVILGLGYWRMNLGATSAQHLVTEVNGMKKVDLPDGSVLRLNGDSVVDVTFDQRERHVNLLRGEAHFAVAKDPRRPFVVEAAGVSVKAVGTEFNVRHAARGIEVVVTEGKVRVDDSSLGGSLLPVGVVASNPGIPQAIPAETVALLVAGQAAFVPRAEPGADYHGRPRVASVAPATPSEIAQIAAWKTRLLEFDRTPLAEVVAEFNRFNSHQLVIADPRLSRQTFGGSLRADNQEVFVQLLEERFNVVAERGSDKTILHARP